MEKRVFIHIPKNGGMSIRQSKTLAPHIIQCHKNTHKSAEYSRSVKKKMDEIGNHHGFEHARWKDLHKTYQNKKAFAIIRNPWSRVVSRYFFAVKTRKDNTDFSFHDFLEERHVWGNVEYMWHRAIKGWYPAFDHVSDDNGNVMCDILRLDDLKNDLNKYFNISQNYQSRNVTGIHKGSYRDMYNNKAIQIIGDWYQKDIDYWGFDFDTGPTKNFWNIED